MCARIALLATININSNIIGEREGEERMKDYDANIKRLMERLCSHERFEVCF